MGHATQHATAAEAHNRLMLTKAFDLSARRKKAVQLPINGGFMIKLLLFFAMLVPSLVLGQGYPNKAIRMIVPFAPGGASDFVGRILQPRMSELLGQQIVVENRAGRLGQHRPGCGGEGCARRLHPLPRQRRHRGDQPGGVPEAAA